jgi:hypothetical protein
VNGVALSISKDLDFNMAWTFQEPFDKDCPVPKSGFRLANSTQKCVFEVGLFTHNTHTATSAAHSRLDDNY